MGVLLKIEGLTKTFSEENKTEHAAVDHVSFQIDDGETVGLVGESGCGKSTLEKQCKKGHGGRKIRGKK